MRTQHKKNEKLGRHPYLYPCSTIVDTAVSVGHMEEQPMMASTFRVAAQRLTNEIYRVEGMVILTMTRFCNVCLHHVLMDCLGITVCWIQLTMHAFGHTTVLGVHFESNCFQVIHEFFCRNEAQLEAFKIHCLGNNDEMDWSHSTIRDEVFVTFGFNVH
jgi:hypothetical protein